MNWHDSNVQYWWGFFTGWTSLPFYLYLESRGRARERRRREKLGDVLGEFEPCPFCGDPPGVTESAGGVYIWCSNDDCPVKPEAWPQPTRSQAIGAWNQQRGIQQRAHGKV